MSQPNQPTKFLIVVNATKFDRKMDAVNFVKCIKKVYKIAPMIKMVSKHQAHLPYAPKGKFKLELWGLGREKRYKVNKLLEQLADQPNEYLKILTN